MKKFLYFLFFFLCFVNVSFAKILNIENKLQLEIPNSHKFMRYEDSEIAKNFEEFIDLIEDIKIDVYLVGPSKYVDLEKAILDGEDPMDNENISILDIYVCSHHRDENCCCRKPKPGMFYKASIEHHIRLDKSIFIGVHEKDIQEATK